MKKTTPVKSSKTKAKPKSKAAPKTSAKASAGDGAWKAKVIQQIRSIMKDVDPEITEEAKWGGIPAWYRDGLICTGETYKTAVKMTFLYGAFLKDPSKLFNSSLEGNQRRAIDVREGEEINVKALKALIGEAIKLNQSKKKK